MLSMAIQLENARTKIQTRIHLTQVSSYLPLLPCRSHSIESYSPSQAHLNRYLLGLMLSDWFLLCFPGVLHASCVLLTLPRLCSGFRLVYPFKVVSSLRKESSLHTQISPVPRTWGGLVIVCQIELNCIEMN